MAAHCCPCNGERARFVRCVCVREKHPCVSCHPKRAGNCKNTSPVFDVGPQSGPPFLHAVTCPAPVVSSVPTSSSFSSPSTSPDSRLDSIHQSNLPLFCVPSRDVAVANISPVNSAMLSPLSSIVNVSVSTHQHVPKGARDSWSDLLLMIFPGIL